MNVVGIKILHAQLAGERADEQSPDRVQRRDFVGQQGPFRLVPEL